jgi:GNAT superfamily N-acetyltransferase
MVIVRYALPNEDEIFRDVTASAFETARDIYRPNGDAVAVTDNEKIDSRKVLAFIDDRPVGAACLNVDGEILQLSQLGVLFGFRRCGVARQLISFANRAAVDFSCTELKLHTIRETGNVKIFERLGFKEQSCSRAEWCFSDRFDQLTDVVMSRTVK